MTLKAGNSTELSPQDWIEEFKDQLSEASGVEEVCLQSLRFVPLLLNQVGGALWVKAIDSAQPYIRVSAGCPAGWQDQLQDPGSPFSRIIEGALQTPQQVLIHPAPGVGAALALPFRGQAQGVLLLHGPEPAEMNLSHLRGLAHSIGRALWRERQANLALLYQVIAEISREGANTKLIGHLEKELCRLMDAHSGRVLVLEDAVGRLTDPAWLARQGGEALVVADAVEPAWLRACMAHGGAVYVDIEQAAGILPAGAGGALCAPLAVQGQPLGGIVIGEKRPGRFGALDRERLEMFANLTAQAIYGHQLTKNLKIANYSLDASHWELLRSRNTLRAIFDNIPAAFYIIDRQYRLIAINRSRANRAGKMPPDLVGKRCYQALFERQSPCAGCKVMEIFDAGRSTTRSERRGGGVDETTEWEISTYPILDEDENIIQAILLEQDVTDRRRLETMMTQSEKLAAVGQLAAGVAHEINNPLTAILANAQMLQRRLPVDDEMQESVDLITRAGERASQVVGNLLDFARKEEYRLVLTDVNETIQRAIELVQHELAKRSIRLVFEPDPALPRLMASREHLSGVWLNLLLNAVDAIDHDGTIGVSTRLSAEKLYVIISDSGSGIPPERINRIFEPFYTTKAPGRGTGLGLSVCHRVIRQHGGAIQVNSQEGVGTEFTIELPIRLGME
jgi:two-component system, NtrC family, sensor kinase